MLARYHIVNEGDVSQALAKRFGKGYGTPTARQTPKSEKAAA
jgi:hypothetical protein